MIVLFIFSTPFVFAQKIDTNTLEGDFFDTSITIDDIKNNPNYIIISTHQEQDHTIYLVQDKTTQETKCVVVEYFTIKDGQKEQFRKNIKFK